MQIPVLFVSACLVAGCGASVLDTGDEISALSQAASVTERRDEGGGKGGACAGGAYNIVLQNGRIVPTGTQGTISAGELGTGFKVKGTHSEFDVDAATFGIRNWTLTGAVNPRGLSNGQRLTVYASKIPDHRGLQLTSAVSISTDEGDVVLTRTGPGLSMKIQAKDCAQGGIFQMEPERADATETRITHVLAPDVFYFDNPFFRARNGETFQYDAQTTLTVTPRINFASDRSPALVGRDSTQEATRIPTSCPNQVQNADGTLAAVNHCGGRSDWTVKSGGRMGQVMGEDSIALEPAQPVCTRRCQSQSQVKGRGLNIGFPSPVPASSRLNPRE